MFRRKSKWLRISAALVLVMTLVVAMLPSPAFGRETSGFRVLSGKEAAAFVVPGDTQLVTSFFLSPYGLTYERYQQYFRTAQVLGGQITLYRNGSGTITTVIGSHFPDITPTNAVRLSRADAAVISGRDVGPAQHRVVDLMIDPDAGRYFFRIESRNLDSRWFHWIDAKNGQVLNKYNAIETDDDTADGTGVKGDTKDLTGLTRLHSSGRPSLRGHWLQSDGNRQLTYDDDNNGGVATIMVDSDNHGNLVTGDRQTPGQPVGVDAQYYADVVDDYYQSVQGRNSFDSHGASMKSIVHFQVDYNNAFWNGEVVVYGDGDGDIFIELSGSLDVAGHEWTHAVTDFTSDLIYRDESGALNESFSDIMGNTIEFFADANGLDPTVTPDWLIGEDIYVPTDTDPGFRNMADPREAGDPDHYNELVYIGTSTDNGGVHTNSGVPNHAYYLLVNGGSNAGCDNVGSNGHIHTADCDVNVTAIGLADAEQIFFLAFTALPSDATMSNARDATVAMAVYLFGANGSGDEDAINEPQSTSDAWEAVGLAPPALDTTAPAISNVEATNITDNSATITWTTDEPADSRVDYGLDDSYGLFVDDTSLVTSHSITLTGLSPSATYHSKVTSADAASNPASSADFTFTTLAAPAGDTVTITKAVYNSKKNGGELKVEATSDASPGAELRITDIGGAVYDIVMTYNEKKDKYSVMVSSLSLKPGTVTVTSSAGDSATSDVGGK